MIKPHDIDPDVWATLTSADAGDTAALRELIERDPRLARCEYWYTPAIHFAVRGGQLEAVKLLLEGGADPEWNGYHGAGLAAMARYRGFEDVAALLEQAREQRGRPAPAEDDPEPPIHAAVAAGDTQRIRELLDADPTLVNRGGRGGCSPLHRAVISGQSETVALLLDRGAEIHAIHGTGLGPGWWAQDVQALDLAVWGGPPGLGPPRATERHAQIAALLLARGALYDLTIAAARGDRERVAAILDEAPEAIREAPRNGRRPLTAAVEFGHDEIVRLLLQRGTDPSLPELGSPTGGALQRAAGAGNREWVELLLAHGADPNGFVDSGGNATFAAKTPEIRALLKAHGGQIDPSDLVWIAGDDEVMQAVTEASHAADRDWGGVFTSVCTNGRRGLLARLLEAGLRVPAVLTGCQAYLLEDVEMLGMLLQSGMDPDLRNWQRQTLLHHLARGAQTEGNRVKCAAMLLDAGASISPRDEEYRSTPLGWAARAGTRDMVEFLLNRGAATHLSDDEPWATPLAWAGRHGHTEIAEKLRSA